MNTAVLDQTLLQHPFAAEKVAAKAWISRALAGLDGIGWRRSPRADWREIAAIADPVAGFADEARNLLPDADLVDSLDALLEVGVDGVVIATPSALHAEQAIAALERGVAVFCQKPLGRNEIETQRVIDAARAANLLLGVDLSYRHMAQANKICELIQSGELGEVYVVDLMFHNAYGPGQSVVL